MRAVLIDAENILPAPFMARYLYDLPPHTPMIAAGVVGNFSLQAWQHFLQPFNGTLLTVPSGKNQADIELSLEGLKLFYQGWRHFTLFTSDRDFSCLIRRLKKEGAQITVIGDTPSHHLAKAGAVLYTLDDLKAQHRLQRRADLATLALLQGLMDIGGVGTWIALSALGDHFKRTPQLSQVLHGGKLKDLLQDLPTVFQTRKSEMYVQLTQKPRFKIPVKGVVDVSSSDRSAKL